MGSALRSFGFLRRRRIFRIDLRLRQSQKQFFQLLTRPRRPPKKDQAGLDAGLVEEALDIDVSTQTSPAVMLDQSGEYGFQGDPMQGIFGLYGGHASP